MLIYILVHEMKFKEVLKFHQNSLEVVLDVSVYSDLYFHAT